MSFVLDASVALCWCFKDEGSRYAEAVFPALRSNHAVVPAIWPAEFANGLTVAERRKRITQATVAELLDAFGALPIQVRSAAGIDRLPHLVAVARQHTLSVYDATYLDLAAREQLPLATIDKQLRRAARKMGVGLFEP